MPSGIVPKDVEEYLGIMKTRSPVRIDHGIVLA